MMKFILTASFLTIGLSCYLQTNLGADYQLSSSFVQTDSLITHQFDTFKISVDIPVNFGEPKHDVWYAYFVEANQDSTVYGGIQIQPEIRMNEGDLMEQLTGIVGWFGHSRGEPGQDNILKQYITGHPNGAIAEFKIRVKEGDILNGLTLGFEKKKTNSHPDSLWRYIFITYLGTKQHYKLNKNSIEKMFLSVSDIE